MPELPEVQTIVNEMNELGLAGKTIITATVFWPNAIHKLGEKSFIKKISGQKIVKIFRRAKYLVFRLSDRYLLIHLRMTGKFFFGKVDKPPAKHEHVRLYFQSGDILHYEDQRKFGRMYLVEEPDFIFNELGLEPLSKEFAFSAFKELCAGRKTALKPFMLNQKYVAGLGNIYVDEALWEAKLHPLQSIAGLSDLQLKALHSAIIKVLKKGIENQGTTLGSHSANYFSISGRKGGNQFKLNVFRKDGRECPRCGTTIQKIRVAQRGTHFCPHCQKENI